MEIKPNISQKIEWLSQRIPLSDQAKDLIAFQMRELVIELCRQFEETK